MCSGSIKDHRSFQRNTLRGKNQGKLIFGDLQLNEGTQEIRRRRKESRHEGNATTT